MTQMEQIRLAFERSAKTLALRPSAGMKTDITHVRVRDGLTCDIQEGQWASTSDLGKKGGGQEQGPTPGMLARAAFGSCLAMCYVMWAAKLGVPLSQVEVEVEADTDLRGMYGVGEVPAGYLEVRYAIKIESPADEADLMHVLDLAETHSPYIDVFRREQTVKRKVHITSVEG